MFKQCHVLVVISEDFVNVFEDNLAHMHAAYTYTKLSIHLSVGLGNRLGTCILLATTHYPEISSVAQPCLQQR